MTAKREARESVIRGTIINDYGIQRLNGYSRCSSGHQNE